MYWLWPQTRSLPIIKQVNMHQLEDVHKDTYEVANGKIKLLSFYYTNCPDICPLTMMDFTDLQNKLKNEGLFGEKVELVAITLDPVHDTKEVIQNYAKLFNADPTGWKWVRGTEEVTKEVADDLQMVYSKLEGGFLAHGTTMYLLDEKNQLRALYDMANPGEPVNTEKIVVDILTLLEN